MDRWSSCWCAPSSLFVFGALVALAVGLWCAPSSLLVLPQRLTSTTCIAVGRSKLLWMLL